MELNKAEIKILWEALSAYVDNLEDATSQEAPQDMLQLLERFDALFAQEWETA